MTSRPIVECLTASQFSDEDLLLDLIGSKLVRGSLALFLGAGISKELSPTEDDLWMGLPSWRTLLQRLLDGETDPDLAEKSYPQKALYFRLKYHKNNYPAYLAAVEAALYENLKFNFTDIRKNDTLAALGALVMNSSRGRVSEVVTFNWDDILERFLLYYGFVTKPVFEAHFEAEVADVRVLHPHGFLPSPGSPFLARSERIIFDQTSYSERTGREADRWNRKLTTILLEHMCLFVGLSGDDPAIDSLAVIARDGYRQGKIPYWGVTILKSPSQITIDAHHERGIFVHSVSDYRHLPDFLFRIVQSAASRR